MVPPREGNEARGMGGEESERLIVPGEAGESGPRDPVEGRGRRQMEPLEGTMANTPRLDPISLKRQRIAELARQASDMVFTSLAHHIDRDMLHAAYVVTRKDGAVGLDGQTADDYAANLEANLQSLLDRFKSGQYVAPPVRRVHIPKGDGRKTRPIGIPTFEDKVLQRAVVMVLESVYEQDFRDCSFGFRPGRSAHQALQHLWEQTMLMGCQGRTKVRPRWRRKIRPPGPVDGVPESGCAAGLERRLGAPVGGPRRSGSPAAQPAACEGRRQDAGAAASWRACVLCARR